MFIDRRLFSSLSTCMAEQHLINLKTLDTALLLLLFYLQGLVPVCWCYLTLACVAAISGLAKVLPGKLKAVFLLLFSLVAFPRRGLKRSGQILIQ